MRVTTGVLILLAVHVMTTPASAQSHCCSGYGLGYNGAASGKDAAPLKEFGAQFDGTIIPFRRRVFAFESRLAHSRRQRHAIRVLVERASNIQPQDDGRFDSKSAVAFQGPYVAYSRVIVAAGVAFRRH